MADSVGTGTQGQDWQNQIFGALTDIAKTAVNNVTTRTPDGSGTPAATQAAAVTPGPDWQKWALYGAIILVVVLVVKKLF